MVNLGRGFAQKGGEQWLVSLIQSSMPWVGQLQARPRNLAEWLLFSCGETWIWALFHPF